MTLVNQKKQPAENLSHSNSSIYGDKINKNNRKKVKGGENEKKEVERILDSIDVISSTKDSLKVRWELNPDQLAMVEGFLVRYRAEGSSVVQYSGKLDKKTSAIDIGQLHENTDYEVCLWLLPPSSSTLSTLEISETADIKISESLCCNNSNPSTSSNRRLNWPQPSHAYEELNQDPISYDYHGNRLYPYCLEGSTALDASKVALASTLGAFFAIGIVIFFVLLAKWQNDDGEVKKEGAEEDEEEESSELTKVKRKKKMKEGKNEGETLRKKGKWWWDGGRGMQKYFKGATRKGCARNVSSASDCAFIKYEDNGNYGKRTKQRSGLFANLKKKRRKKLEDTEDEEEEEKQREEDEEEEKYEISEEEKKFPSYFSNHHRHHHHTCAYHYSRHHGHHHKQQQQQMSQDCSCSKTTNEGTQQGEDDLSNCSRKRSSFSSVHSSLLSLINEEPGNCFLVATTTAEDNEENIEGEEENEKEEEEDKEKKKRKGSKATHELAYLIPIMRCQDGTLILGGDHSNKSTLEDKHQANEDGEQEENKSENDEEKVKEKKKKYSIDQCFNVEDILNKSDNEKENLDSNFDVLPVVLSPDLKLSVVDSVYVGDIVSVEDEDCDCRKNFGIDGDDEEEDEEEENKEFEMSRSVHQFPEMRETDIRGASPSECGAIRRTSSFACPSNPY